MEFFILLYIVIAAVIIGRMILRWKPGGTIDPAPYPVIIRRWSDVDGAWLPGYDWKDESKRIR